MTGTFTWADGEAGDQTFAVNIIDDTESEGNETLALYLTSPVGGATLGSTQNLHRL